MTTQFLADSSIPLDVRIFLMNAALDLANREVAYKVKVAEYRAARPTAKAPRTDLYDECQMLRRSADDALETLRIAALKAAAYVVSADIR
jgi:predicted peroxiredoxin